MRAEFRRCTRYGLAVAVAGLVLAGCGVDPMADDGPTPKAEATTTPAATATPQPDPVPTQPDSLPTPTAAGEQQPEETRVPPELALMPPDEEIDRMVAEAEQAYRDHWELYAAAVRTGFSDAELVDTLLATAGEDTLEGLHLQVAAIGDTGRVVDGGADVVGMELYALNPPTEGGPALGVLFDACVRTWGELRESDGTVVRELAGTEPEFARARLVDHDGAWLLVSQVLQGVPCPDQLVADGGTT